LRSTSQKQFATDAEATYDIAGEIQLIRLDHSMSWLPFGDHPSQQSRSNVSVIARTTIGATFIVAAFAGAPTARAEAPTFQSLVQAYYSDEFRAHPIAATRIGVHDYDTKIDDLTAPSWVLPHNVLENNRADTSSSAICAGKIAQRFLLLRGGERIENLAALQ
jgi:hypothetical protein